VWEDIRSNYAIWSNLLVQFDRDNIDKIPRLAGSSTAARFPG